MRSWILSAAFLAGCASGPAQPEPAPRAGCVCEKKICVCPHCKGAAAKCPCKEIEKPK
jgi:hypothetical protein